LVSSEPGPASQRHTLGRANVKLQEQSTNADGVEQLAASIEAHAQQILGDKISIDKGWKQIDVIGFKGRPGAETLQLSFTTQTSETPFVVFLVAWQPLFSLKDDSTIINATPPLLTVTDRALVFGSVASVTKDASISLALRKAVGEAIRLDKNQYEITNALNWALPEKLRIISLQVYPHYAIVQAALPGSGILQPDELSRTFPARMVHLSLVPDKGRVVQQWIAPAKSATPSARSCPCKRK